VSRQILTKFTMNSDTSSSRLWLAKCGICEIVAISQRYWCQCWSKSLLL